MQKTHTILDFIIAKRYVFAAIFFTVSFSTFMFLNAIGVMPDQLKTSSAAPEITAEEQALIEEVSTETRVPAEASLEVRGELPMRIFIDKIGVNSIISNPVSTNVSVLDAALSKGAVRYPTSAKLGEGNLFLFGHSTNRAVVNNQAYKTFNNLDKLVAGDIIVVESATHFYTYRVFSVHLTNADEALVDLSTKRNMLTISTCNTFGQKQERFVVEADFVRATLK